MKNKKIILPLIIMALGFFCYFTIDNILFNGIKPKVINETRFQAKLFSQDDISNETTVVLIGGGNWGDYWAQEFSKRGMVGMSLPYIGISDVPNLIEEVPLEYFKNAIDWLANQEEVNPSKIVVMGASRNAELALILATKFPKLIHGVVAYAPSAISWSNTVLPYSSEEIKASWILYNKNIPYLSMDKININNDNTIDLLKYWKNGLSNLELVNEAAIKIEDINGPILLFSGLDDQVWPAAQMAKMIEDRARINQFKYAITSHTYKNAGHLISGDPMSSSIQRRGSMYIKNIAFEYEFGGTQEGDDAAKKDAQQKLLAYLEKI